MTSRVRVRFAPSPTGLMHIGNARAALYNWLWARHVGGSFLLRIEDTDRERSTPENVSFLHDALRWLGIDSDEPPVVQSANVARHRELVSGLIADGKAYYCTAAKADVDTYKQQHGWERGFRGETADVGAVRLRVPDIGHTVVRDLIRGESRFENVRLDDPVIARADGTPLYNLAVAVDDADMGITHVIRGEDHLANTARQLLVFAALGFPAPVYAHLPLIHGADGKKLAKRHGAASVQEFRAAGILPEALINYLAHLGWGTDDDTTFLTPAELISRFDIARVSRNPAQFDEVKLRWLNGLWIREMDPRVLTVRVQEFAGGAGLDLYPAVLAAREKIHTLADFWPLVGSVYDGPVDDAKARARVLLKNPEATAAALELARSALAKVEPWDAAHIEAALADVLSALGVKPGGLYQPLRVALTGTTVSPGIFDTLALFDRDEALRRIDLTLTGL